MKRTSFYFKEHPYCLYKPIENSPFPLPTNSQGLIGKTEYKKIKPINTKRILVLGASPVLKLPPASENKDKNPNYTLTHIMESKLNEYKREEGSCERFEVINLSATAYTSYECLFAYICKGKDLEADLVISYQGVNDVMWAIVCNNFADDYSHVRTNNFHKKQCWVNNLFCSLPDSKIISFLDRVFIKFNLKKPNGLIYSISKGNQTLDVNYNSNKLKPFMENIRILNSISNLYSSRLINFSFVWDESRPACPAHVYKQLKELKYKNIFNVHYNRYLNDINKLLNANKELHTYTLPKEEFPSSCFYDGVHFSLEGMNKIATLGAKYIIDNEKTIFNN